MIRAHTITAPGGRPTSGAAFALHPCGTGRLVALADGQGGRAGGAEAARLACRAFVAAATQPGVDLRGRVTWSGGPLWEADRAAAEDPAAGLTSLLGFYVDGGRVSGGSCGDCALLATCGSGQDHRLTARQEKDPPVGSGEAWFTAFEAELVRPWKLLAVPAGVWKRAGWSKVRELALRASGAALLEELQAAARLGPNGSFQDDFTAVLLESE
jgi:hypothetical protein